MKQRRIGIYLRVSTVEQDTTMQEVEMREYAEHRSWDITIYRDHGQSGATDDRPGLKALLSDVRRTSN